MSNPSISINYLPEEKVIEILDSESLLIGNRRAKWQISQMFNVSSIVAPIIRLDVEQNSESLLVEDSLKELLKLLEFLNVIAKLDKSAKSVVESYLAEEAAFRSFSEEAKDIWNGSVQATTLMEFTRILSEGSFERSLYSLQLLSSFHLAFSQNACNFSVPGAGKTSTVLAAFAYLRSLPADNIKHVNKILVVGPTSCFKPWESEFELCFGYTPNSFRISGELNREEIESVLFSLSEINLEKELFLITYQSLANHQESIKLLLSRHGNRFMVVLDEAHRAKNTDGGLWANTALSLAPHAKSRVVLTGTPAPNGYQDLFNLFEFIWPGKGIIGYKPEHLRGMTENQFDSRREVVLDNLTPYFTRITKSDLGIPAAVDNHPIFVKMGPVQREIYEYIESAYLDYFDRESSNPRNILVRSRQIRLMQAASNPALLKKPITDSNNLDFNNALFVDDAKFIEEIENYLNLETPAKFVSTVKRVKELLEIGEKVVIWAYYIGNILGLSDYLKQHSINCRLLYGAVPLSSNILSVETRESIIENFHQIDSEFQVIIANPYAVGESISLHKACQHAIYFERNFNAAVFLQSKDRVHRYGMPESTTATYDYVQSTNSVEDTISRRLDQKIQLMMEITESRGIPLFDLTRDSVDCEEDDITAIINDYLSRKGFSSV